MNRVWGRGKRTFRAAGAPAGDRGAGALKDADVRVFVEPAAPRQLPPGNPIGPPPIPVQAPSATTGTGSAGSGTASSDPGSAGATAAGAGTAAIAGTTGPAAAVTTGAAATNGTEPRAGGPPPGPTDTAPAAPGSAPAAPDVLPIDPVAAPAGPALPPVPSSWGLGVSFMRAAALVFSAAAAITIMAYVIAVPPAPAPGWWPKWWFDWWPTWKGLVAPVAALAVAALGGGVFALINRDRATPDRLDPTSYDQIHDRLNALDARLRALRAASTRSVPAQMAYLEATARRDIVVAALQSSGPRWVMGTGFVELWRHLHAAEAALFIIDPVEDLIGQALFDEMRLKGSDIKNHEDLLAKLRFAVADLAPQTARRYLTPGDPSISTSDTAAGTPGANPAAGQAPPPPDPTATAAQARVVQRDIRRMINSFRDDKWEGLARSRNRLITTGAFTGLTAYALLVLATVNGAPEGAIVGAATFYLVGGIVGLFAQLGNDAKEDHSATEDFGFARARLIHTPMLSGIAAVGGVLVVAMLYAALDGSGLVYAVGETAAQVAQASPAAGQTAAQTTQPLPATGETATQAARLPLATIFDLRENTFGLLIAAVFGLTPDLLVNRLQQRSDQLRAELKSTSAHEMAPTGRA